MDPLGIRTGRPERRTRAPRPCSPLRWRRALALAGLALVASCSAGEAPAPPLEGAHLVCPRPSVDLGTVWEGAVLEHTFVFTSAGTEPVVVQGSRADCGCTVARLERIAPDGARVPYVDGQPLEPGAELFLVVTYDTTGKVGAGERQVKLFCNEEDGMAGAALVANVERRFVTVPDPPPAARLAVGGSDAVSFEVQGVGEGAFALEHEPRGLPASVAVELTPLPGDRGDPAAARARRWRVDVSFGPETPRGTHSYPIFLRTDLVREDRPQADARFSFAPFVIVQVLGRFSAEPASLSFGAVRDDETVSRTVRVTCNDPDFALREPRVELVPLVAERSLAWAEQASLHVRAVPEARAWDVEIVLEGIAPETEDTFLGRLDIHTEHPLEPTVSVNVAGFRADRRSG